MDREAFESILGGDFADVLGEPGRRANEDYSTYTDGEDCFCRPLHKPDTKGRDWSEVIRLMVYAGLLPLTTEEADNGDTDAQAVDGGRAEAEIGAKADSGEDPVIGPALPIIKVATNVGNAQKAKGDKSKSGKGH